MEFGGRYETIISQFLLKSLHIILDSRIPSLRPHDRSGDLTPLSHVRKSDRWFTLALGDRPAALENLNFWHRNVLDPMIIDVILVHEGHRSSGVAPSVETVIERWVVQYVCPGTVMSHSNEGSASYKKMYKKSIILLRSLYSTMRLLPAYRIFRQLSSSNQTYNFDLIYKVSSFSEPFSRAEEESMRQFSFTPLEAPQGRLLISVTYCTTLSDFNLEPSSTTPPQIITDYVGSPAADPLKIFPSTERGVGATSFPLRGVQSPSSAPFQRPHTWTSGLHRPAPPTQNYTPSGSPPVHRIPIPSDYSSSPPDIYSHRTQSHRSLTHKKGMSLDDYSLSPPFSSSPSPSPPTYFSSGNPSQIQLRSESAPVSIPLPIMGRHTRYPTPNSSDPNRHSLPPMSPKSTKPDLSSQESSSGSRSFRKTDVLRAGDFYSGITNIYSGQKVSRDSKDDSGRFSGGLVSSSGSPRIGFSRSSSRLSFQDDLDDCDFSCPFAVDDVDTSDSQIRTLDGKEDSESSVQPLPPARKSQDAAVGLLVHMLRTAPPLRQDRSCYSYQSSKTKVDGEVGIASEFFMGRKTADAMEELRSYKEMKDLLQSQSGLRVVTKGQAKPTNFVE